jgi:hypothetical protein
MSEGHPGTRRGLHAHPARLPNDGKSLLVQISTLVVTSALTVGVGVFGFWLAAYIDEKDAARADQILCTSSVLQLRESLISLKRGYSIDRSDKPNRLADWDEVRFALDQVTFACGSALRGDEKIAAAYAEVREALSSELVTAFQGYWDDATVISAVAWTDDALDALASGR